MNYPSGQSKTPEPARTITRNDRVSFLARTVLVRPPPRGSDVALHPRRRHPSLSQLSAHLDCHPTHPAIDAHTPAPLPQAPGRNGQCPGPLRPLWRTRYPRRRLEVSVWGALTAPAHDHLRKGCEVLVVGVVESGHYTDRQGNIVDTLKLTAQVVKFLGHGATRRLCSMQRGTRRLVWGFQRFRFEGGAEMRVSIANGHRQQPGKPVNIVYKPSSSPVGCTELLGSGGQKQRKS